VEKLKFKITYAHSNCRYLQLWSLWKV